jgi:hypothetical protein
MLSGLEPLWDSCERAEFCLTSTTDVSIWVTGCKVTKMLRLIQRPAGVDGGAGGLMRDVGCAGGS